jgi:hypothetical protein
MTHQHEAPDLYIIDASTNTLATDQGFCTFFDLCRWAEQNLTDTWWKSGYKIEER